MKLHRDGARLLQLLIFNEEFLVSACHQRALITSLPFVHTARRSYRLNDPVRPPDCGNAAGSPATMLWEAVQTLSFRGRRSRNKVSVGEPAEGSLPVFPPTHCAHRIATLRACGRALLDGASSHNQGWSCGLCGRCASAWRWRRLAAGGGCGTSREDVCVSHVLREPPSGKGVRWLS